MRVSITPSGLALALGLALAPTAVLAQDTAAALDHYYQLRTDQPEQAYNFLLQQEPALRGDIRVELELAYYLIQRERFAEALPRLETAVAIDPARADVWAQLGYVRLALEQREEALEAFDRSLALQPSEQLALQRAYLLQDLGRNRASAGAFRDLTGSPAPEISGPACAAHQVLYNVPDRVFSDPWFGEVYFAPEYNSHWKLGVLPAQTRIGATLDEQSGLDVYLGLRVGADTRSVNTPLGPQTYNDNALVLAGGVRVRPVDGLTLFAEAGTAYDLIDQGRDRWRGDVRAGGIYYNEWNMAPPCDSDSSAIRPVADVYAEGIYYSRYDDNVLFYLRVRPGVRVSESRGHAIDLYALGAIGADTRGVDYNNFEELGGGLALKLYNPAGLAIRGEGVQVFRHEGLESYATIRLRLEYQARF